jgi:hypothetical protein
VRILRLDEFLALAGLTKQQVKTLRRRDQLALAFGRRDAYSTLNYIELDAVAVLLVEELARSFDKTVAAQIVKLHADIWGFGVAESETSKSVFFIVAEFVDSVGRRTHLAGCSRTADAEQIRKGFAKQPYAAGHEFARAVVVPLSRLLERVRINAKQAGIDVSGPFLPPPGDHRFKEIFAPYVKARDLAVASVQGRNDNDIALRLGNRARANMEELVDEPMPFKRRKGAA